MLSTVMPLGRRDQLLIVLLGLLLCGLRLWEKSLWSADEARYAQIAREMTASRDYLIPRMYGEPEASYPPLYYWLICLSSALLGGVTPFSATLPTLLAALGVSLQTYRLGCILWDRRTGLVSSLTLVTMSGFVGPSILCRADMVMVLLEVWALLQFIRWYVRTDRESTRFPLTFYVAVALATLTKGPQATAVSVGIVLAFLGVRRELRLVRRLCPAPGLAIVLGLTAPWYLLAWLATGKDFVLHESLGGFLGTAYPGGHFRRPFLEYLGVVFVRAFPWILFLPSALVFLRREEKGVPASPLSRARFSFLVSWLLVVFVFYSLAASKRHYYIAALYPALALILGRLAISLPTASLSSLYVSIPLGLLALFAVGLDLVLYVGPNKILLLDLVPLRPWLYALNVGILLGALAGLFLIGKGRDQRVAPLLLGLVLAAHLTSILAYELPRNRENQNEGRRWVKNLSQAILPQESLYLYREDLPQIPFYLRRECRMAKDPESLRDQAARGDPIVVGVREWRKEDNPSTFSSFQVVARESLPNQGAVLLFLRPKMSSRRDGDR